MTDEASKHSAEVRAASVYEAVCRAWAIFNSSRQTEEESYKTEEFTVEVYEPPPKQFRVNSEKLLESFKDAMGAKAASA